MSSKIQVKLEKKKWQMLTPQVQKKGQLLMDKHSFDVAAFAIQSVPVDTAATKASIYVSGASKGARFIYAAARSLSAKLAAASGRRIGIWWFDEVRPKDEWERIIGASTWYAWIVEYTNKSFLRAALMSVHGKVVKDWKDLFDGIL